MPDKTIELLSTREDDSDMLNVILLSCFAIFFCLDMLHDLADSVPLEHIWHEGILFILALGGLVWQLVVIGKKTRQLNTVNKELLETKASYVEWQKKSQSSTQALRDMIDQQFETWQLSPSEKDVALLLIKGLAMKEIADIRQTHEKTVRQQATTIYRKASLSGRQELAAFFLEDVLSLS